MANPPITIGPFTNVPAPGSPIKSDWPQSISTWVAALPYGFVDQHFGGSSDQTGITGVTDIPGAVSTWTAVAARAYLIIGTVVVRQITAAGDASIYLTDGANASKSAATVSLAANGIGNMTTWIVETGLSGSVTRKLRASTGAGTLTVIGAANQFARILVLDLGTTAANP